MLAVKYPPPPPPLGEHRWAVCPPLTWPLDAVHCALCVCVCVWFTSVTLKIAVWRTHSGLTWERRRVTRRWRRERKRETMVSLQWANTRPVRTHHHIPEPWPTCSCSIAACQVVSAGCGIYLNTTDLHLASPPAASTHGFIWENEAGVKLICRHFPSTYEVLLG